jgi:hypothetical protein
MDYILNENLPPCLVYKIAKLIHNMYMRDLRQEIENNVIWCRLSDGTYSFLIGKTNNNPYYPLIQYIKVNEVLTHYFLQV